MSSGRRAKRVFSDLSVVGEGKKKKAYPIPALHQS